MYLDGFSRSPQAFWLGISYSHFDIDVISCTMKTAPCRKYLYLMHVYSVHVHMVVHVHSQLRYSVKSIVRQSRVIWIWPILLCCRFCAYCRSTMTSQSGSSLVLTCWLPGNSCSPAPSVMWLPLLHSTAHWYTVLLCTTQHCILVYSTALY